ncbi:MAG: ABC transporter ATP-binding protein [Candidatus Methanodesulfokora sp.]
MALLDVEELVKHFPIRYGLFGKIAGYVKAVDGVSFSIDEESVFSLVGESGSGKSTVARCVLRLLDPTSGRIAFKGRDITSLRGKNLKWYRRNVQAVFQNPFLSLNPRMRVESIIAEPLRVHMRMSRDEAKEEVRRLLEKVGLSREIEKRHPHELSGGQAQRIAIARAIAPQPKLLVLDEPTSALDVSVQAQILNLLADLKNDLKLSYLLISHDLSVVKYISDYVAVMYLGRIVEYAPAEELFNNPAHPYTRALLSSVPEPDPNIRRLKSRIILPGEPPSPVNPPAGCRLSPRCPYAMDQCRAKEPELISVGNGHFVRCWFIK